MFYDGMPAISMLNVPTAKKPIATASTHEDGSRMTHSGQDESYTYSFPIDTQSGLVASPSCRHQYGRPGDAHHQH